MQGRQLRCRRVSTALIKPFYKRPEDLRHPMAYEFAQQVWIADLGLSSQPSVAARSLYTLMDRREVPSETRRTKWEYRETFQDGKESEWLSEVEVLDSFIPLQLDVFHALWNFYYYPNTSHTPPPPPQKRRRNNRAKALEVYPIGTRGYKRFGNQEFEGQIYDYLDGRWRARYQDNDWELTRREMKRFMKGTA